MFQDFSHYPPIVEENISQMKIIICLLLQSMVLIAGKECSSSAENSSAILCLENESPNTNFSHSLSNVSHIVDLSIIHSYLNEMPDLSDFHLLAILHLDYNQIQLFHRNYSSVEFLYLTSNHIYSLHQTNLYYPNLKHLDLSHNPIEHIIGDFFSAKQFPQLQTLRLVKAFSNINPFLIENRLISFVALISLREIDLDENDLEDFSCSSNTTHVQWKLPANLSKISLAKNRLTSFDRHCLSDTRNLTDLSLHFNYLRELPTLDTPLPHLSKLQLGYNSFTDVPSRFLHSFPRLAELDLSANPLSLQGKLPVFPAHLRILHLNSITGGLSCQALNNLEELEQLHLARWPSNRLDSCALRKLSRLKTLDLSYHRLRTIDERIFGPLLSFNQLQTLDIRSDSLPCQSCSLRWLILHSNSNNQTDVKCLDQHGGETLLNSLALPPCSSSHLLSTSLIAISVTFSFCLFVLFFIYSYQNRKFPFLKSAPVYHMVPLRRSDRIYQNTTEDITNDNVMLVVT